MSFNHVLNCRTA